MSFVIMNKYLYYDFNIYYFIYLFLLFIMKHLIKSRLYLSQANKHLKLRHISQVQDDIVINIYSFDEAPLIEHFIVIMAKLWRV